MGLLDNKDLIYSNNATVLNGALIKRVQLHPFLTNYGMVFESSAALVRSPFPYGVYFDTLMYLVSELQLHHYWRSRAKIKCLMMQHQKADTYYIIQCLRCASWDVAINIWDLLKILKDKSGIIRNMAAYSKGRI